MLRYISKRAEADAQIRHRFADLLEDCPISKLRAISAFGTKLAFYSADKVTRHIEPISIQNSINVITDTAPIQWWEENDVLNKECSCKLLDIINTIKDDCNKNFIA